MRSSRLGFSSQVERQRGVTPVQLRGLDQPFGTVYGIGGETYRLEAGLHQIHESMDLRLTDHFANFADTSSLQAPVRPSPRRSRLVNGQRVT